MSARFLALGIALLVAVPIPGLVFAPVSAGESAHPLPAAPALGRPISADPGVAAGGSVPGTWYPISGNAYPPRDRAGVADDPAAGGLLLFGGYNPTTSFFFNDTWLLKNGTWSQLHPATAPSVRSTMSLAYDSSDQEVLLFGGHGSVADLNDTWTFGASGNWVLLPTPAGLSPREGYALCDDPPDHGVLLFGGDAGSPSAPGLNDTWLFRGGSWSQHHPAHVPTGRTDTACGWDATGQEDVLFGGVAADPPATDFGDTWVYRSGDWTNLSVPGPSARIPNSLVPTSSGGLVTYSGACPSVSCGNDTWVFGNGSWQELPETPHPTDVAFASLAYDPATSGTFLTGGAPTGPPGGWTNATWEFGLPSVSATTSVSSFDLGGIASATVGSSPPIGGGSLTVTWGDHTGGTVVGGGQPPQTVTHDYATAGTFTAVVTWYAARGPVLTTNLTFLVAALPQLAVTVSPPNGTTPLPVVLSGRVTGGTAPFRWVWDQGDGSGSENTTSSAGSLTANLLFGSNGTFAVHVSVADGDGNSAVANANVTVATPSSPGTHHAGPSPSAGAPLGITFGGWLLIGGAVAAAAVLAGLLVLRRRRP